MTFAQALVESVNINPYREGEKEEIEALRGNGCLAIDFYLQGLQDQYPPTSVDALVKLVGDIETNTRLNHQERALVIFQIFQAFEINPATKGLAEYYAQELHIPVSWQNYARALYALQKHQNEQALTLLGTFPAPRQVIDCFITCFASTPQLLCLFFDCHRYYLSQDNLNEYISALCQSSMYFNVLEILRGYTLQQDDILRMLGEHAASLTEGAALAAFVSVPFSDQEWQVIQGYLDEQPAVSPAGKLSLARALSLGDLPEINRMKDVEEFKLLTSSYDDY